MAGAANHCELASPPFRLTPPVPIYPQMGADVMVGGSYLGSGPEPPTRSQDFQPIRVQPQLQSSRPDVHHGSSQRQPHFYHSSSDEDHHKSESPSRKRQKLVRSPVSGGHGSHHHGSHHHHHHHHGGHQQQGGSGLGQQRAMRPPTGSAPSRHHHYPRQQPARPLPRPLPAPPAANIVNVPIAQSLLLYTNVPPPAPALPPCQLPSGIIWPPHQPSQLPPHHMEMYGHGGGRGCPHHQAAAAAVAAAAVAHHHQHHQHHHHQHGGPSSAHQPPPQLQEPPLQEPALAVLRASPPTHFPPPDSFELEIIVDHPYHRRPPGIIISELPPPPPAQPPRPNWTAPVAPPPPPRGLIHFLTMIDSLPPVYNLELGPVLGQDNYEELLALEEWMGDAKPRGLTRPELDTLPSYMYDARNRGDQTYCVVCMCDFEMGQTLRKLHCAHMFHSKCVDKWLKSNRTCPICRRDAAGNPPKVVFYSD